MTRFAPHGELLGEPTAHASVLYRALVVISHVIARLFGLRIELQGAELLPRDQRGRPAGGWIAAGLPHRTWIDPFIVAMLLPVEPRLVFLGDGRAIFRSPLRRWIFGRLGGIVPIWPAGGREAFDAHVDAAVAALRVGAVFTLMPEVGPPVPPEQARPLAAGLGYFALRSGAPIVPLVLGGSDELYRGRHIVLRVLAPVTAAELAGFDPAAPPAPGSAAERRAAHAVAQGLHERTAHAVAELYLLTKVPAGTSKRWRWLTTLFR